jgi:hypothetical protein
MIGTLPKSALDSIRLTLPSLPKDWQDITFPEQFAFTMNDMNKGETTHISLVCLGDAFARADSALNCLFDGYANLIWFRKEKENIDDSAREFFAVLKGKFYAEYCFLFLYAIGEDIADFVLSFLTKEVEFNAWQKIPNIKDKLDKKKITSKAARVGVFMAEEYPRRAVTRRILKLRDSKCWSDAMKYRNTWVHDKPPIVAGLGIQYNRQNKIWSDKDAIGIGLGTWSKPKYEVDEVLKIAHDATTICVEVLVELLKVLKRKRNELRTPIL